MISFNMRRMGFLIRGQELFGRRCLEEESKLEQNTQYIPIDLSGFELKRKHIRIIQIIK
jgi:hypothetical protein